MYAIRSYYVHGQPHFTEVPINDFFQIVRAAPFEEQKLLSNELTVIRHHIKFRPVFVERTIDLFEDGIDTPSLPYPDIPRCKIESLDGRRFKLFHKFGIIEPARTAGIDNNFQGYRAA